MRTSTKGLALNFDQEVPSGTVNGSNTNFTLSQTPYSAKAVIVFLDGIVQTFTTDWSISGTTLTFVTAPAAGQKPYVWFLRKT